VHFSDETDSPVPSYRSHPDGVLSGVILEDVHVEESTVELQDVGGLLSRDD
jgi:hypothetical protein